MSETKNYCETAPLGHRKRWGQFFTPPQVANFMIEWVLGSGLPELYDPAYGLGAFHPRREGIRFSATEIDPLILAHTDLGDAKSDCSIRREDYLAAWGRTHGNIVCNPPYMRFQRFEGRSEVFAAFNSKLRIRLSGYTNTASAFLIKSLSELDRGGRLSYIMPLEFLNTGYGAIIKERLITNQHLVSLINLKCEKDIFPDATTSVGIILYDSSKHHSHVNFHSVKSINDLNRLSSLDPTSVVSVGDLDPKQKWLPYFQTSKVSVDVSRAMPLEYYGRFSRGIATGANEFFVLTPSKAKLLGLRESECLPCVTRSSQIRQAVFTNNDIQELLQDDAPLLLFSANGSASDAACRYIKQGEAQGYHERFLTKNRTPWYKTEQRPSAPLLLGVFSRGGYKMVLNRSNALNLTCYHGFQPNLSGLEYLEPLFLYFLSTAGREIASLAMRKYGGSLDKFEPNDLNSSLVPSPGFFDMLNGELVKTAVAEVENTGILPGEIERIFQKMKKPNKAVHPTLTSAAGVRGCPRTSSLDSHGGKRS